MHLKLIACSAVFMLWTLFGRAQDPSFTQFENFAIYYNPASIGAEEGMRFASNSRYQWPAHNTPYITNAVGFSCQSEVLQGGFGGYIMHDHVGAQDDQYAMATYALKLNAFPGLSFSVGASAGFGSYTIDASQLFYAAPDSLQAQGIQLLPANQADFPPHHYFSSGIGFRAFTETFYAGFAVDHFISYRLNGPETNAPMYNNRYVAELGYAWSPTGNNSLKIEGHLLYQYQQPVGMFRLSAITTYNWLRFGGGIGLPGMVYSTIGYAGESFGIAYSYDVYQYNGPTGTEYNIFGPTHELALNYRFNNN